MKLVFFNNILNHHQVNVADELFRILGPEYAYVATVRSDKIDLKGGVDYSSRTYCLLAGDSDKNRQMALSLACTADVCVFGAESLDYAIVRAKENPNGLSFELSERWLKKGLLNILSPRLRRWWVSYQLYFRKANFYKLNASAFAASDHIRLYSYKNRQFKWGYFTGVNENTELEEKYSRTSKSEIQSFMWCARFLKWKHPELPVFLAASLRKDNYKFHLVMYGDGEYYSAIDRLIKKLHLEDYVTLQGNVSNEQVREAMAKSDIFLFTSDKNEGWGAVANESLSCGCVLVSSDSVGSSPFLIADGENGFMFHGPSVYSSFDNPDRTALDDLVDKVKWLLDHKYKINEMQENAVATMNNIWSPKHAAESLLQLIDDLHNGKETTIIEGPCSKA